MDGKTLNVIQVLAKIARILCRIIYIACIVGICACLISLIVLPIGGGNVIKIGGVSIYSIISANADVASGTLYAAIAIGVVICAGEMFLAKIAAAYFEHELAAGTPFTYEGAREMMMLGIHALWIPIVSIALANVAYRIIRVRFINIADMRLDNCMAAGFGIAFIIGSLLCRHGADIENRKNTGEEI